MIEPVDRALPVYRLQESIPKRPGDAYAVHVENFERVAEGALYASIDEEELTAEKPFYPVLMSPHGYETQFGYAAEQVREDRR